MKKCLECGVACSGIRCIDCFKKTQIIKVGDLEFSSKKELDLIIKQRIKEAPRNIEFEDKLLLKIINELHPVWRSGNIKCKKLKFLTWSYQTGDFEYARDIYRGNMLVTGFFDNGEGLTFWESVTLYPHKKENQTVRSKLNLILREEWSRNARKRNGETFCENDESHRGRVHLHHENISFKEIAEQCIDLFTEEEKKIGCVHDRSNHPAILKMHELHTKVKYRWLCHECHEREHKKEDFSNEHRI